MAEPWLPICTAPNMSLRPRAKLLPAPRSMAVRVHRSQGDYMSFALLTVPAPRPLEIQVRALQSLCGSHSMPSDIAVAWARLIASMSACMQNSSSGLGKSIHTHLALVVKHRLQPLADDPLNLQEWHHEVDAWLLCMSRGSILFHVFMFSAHSLLRRQNMNGSTGLVRPRV